MDLADLGFDSWFEERRGELGRPESPVARITAADKDRYLVRNEQGEIAAELTGRLRFSAETSVDFPAVGDWAAVQYHNEGTLAIIHELLERKTVLKRKRAGKRVDHQLIAANIDKALIVQSCDANFSVRRMERYIVMIHDGAIEPIILLSKSDLVSQEELDEMIEEVRRVGIEVPVIPFSNEEKCGLDEVRGLLGPGKTFCLLGSSGVGKTTLLNRLSKDLSLATGAVREMDGKGRHTTTRRQMVLLENNSLMIDTPGMRELANIGADSGLEESFPEIEEMATRCRFADCTHTKEAGCSVLAARESGDLDEGRYQSYISLVKESAFYQMSYYERRQKDKKFAKLCKSVMEERRKQGKRKP